MKYNKNMEKYKLSLIEKKSQCIKRLGEIDKKIAELYLVFADKSKDIENTSERIKCFKQLFGDLPKEKKKLENEILKINTDLIEKKYANRIGYTDVEPYEVIEEKTPNMYIVRFMKSMQTENSKKALRDSFEPCGFLGIVDNQLQDWEIVSDVEAPTFIIRRHKNGNWYDANHWEYCISDKPEKFFDFNF